MMWVTIVITCGWLSGVKHCELATPFAFPEEVFCRLAIAEIGLLHLKDATARGFDISGGFADCQLVEIESEAL